MSLDPVTLALFQNRLDYIARQMGYVMTRTARSPIFSQSHDFSCFITDGRGQLVSQADGIPIHTGGGGFAVRAVLAAFGDQIAVDDVFLLNDPYVAGGNHLPDWVIARPVLVRDRLVAFTCNRAHQADIGGGAAGTYNSAATEIWHEGIRLPPLRLVEGGRTREDLWQLLLLNSRTAHALDGDLRAMLGSTRIGEELVREAVLGLGAGAEEMGFEGILDHGEHMMRAALAGLPEGVYYGEDGYDDDCFEPVDLRIRLTLTIESGSAHADFTGTDPQLRGFKNSSLANTHAAVYAAFSSFFDSSIPRNEGSFRAIRITAPEGTLVNARPPAALTMNTVFPAQQIMHACWQALGDSAPARGCAGWGMNLFPIASGAGHDNRTFVVYHWGGGAGAGAVHGRDGFNQMGPMITLGGLVLPNGETWEQLYPVRVLRQEFRRDAAGAGRWRGGTGVDYVVDTEVPAEYSFRGEGTRVPRAYGCAGGRAGATGRSRIVPEDGPPFEPPTYGVRRLGPCRLVVASGGGGGFGDPLERDPSLVLRDVRDEVLSPEAAEADYGVVLAADRRSVDAAATAQRRAELRQAAPTANRL